MNRQFYVRAYFSALTIGFLSLFFFLLLFLVSHRGAWDLRLLIFVSAGRPSIDPSVQYSRRHLRGAFYFMTFAEQTPGRGWYKAFSLIPRRAIGI
jgi:hypothetical protein